jgi:hypothetical protein
MIAMIGRPVVRALVLISLVTAHLASESKSALARIRVSQESARPGESIQVDVRGKRVATNEPIRALFDDGVRAPARFTGEGQLEVTVPLLPVGESTVAVYQGRRLLGRGTLEIRDASTRRLMFSYGPEGIALVRTTRSAGSPTGHTRSRGARLSFDLVNANGAVVYSATIPDPGQARPEVLTQPLAAGGPVVIGRGLPETAGIFFLEIPTPPGRVSLRVYRADGSLDLFTAQGRSQRRPLATVEVTP